MRSRRSAGAATGPGRTLLRRSPAPARTRIRHAAAVPAGRDRPAADRPADERGRRHQDRASTAGGRPGLRRERPDEPPPVFHAQLERLRRVREPRGAGAAAGSGRRVRCDGLPEPRPATAGRRGARGADGRGTVGRRVTGDRKRAAGARDRRARPGDARRFPSRRRRPPRSRSRHRVPPAPVEAFPPVRAGCARRVLFRLRRQRHAAARRPRPRLRASARRRDGRAAAGRAAAPAAGHRGGDGPGAAARRGVDRPAASSAARVQGRPAARGDDDGHRTRAAGHGTRRGGADRADRGHGLRQRGPAHLFRDSQRLRGRTQP